MVWNILSSQQFPFSPDLAARRGIAESEERLKSFEHLVRQWESQVFAVCRRFHGSSEAAELSCEDAFVALYRSGMELESSNEILQGLLTYVIQDALDSMRSNRGSDLAVDETLCVALARLLPPDRKIVLLRFVCGCSVEEIARLMGASLNQIERHLWNAMAALGRSGIGAGGDN